MLTAHDLSHGYVLHLDHASWWRIVGAGVTGGQKGVVVDGCTGCVLQGLTVSDIGDEGIHLRDFTTDSVVLDNVVRDTGQFNHKFGKGIYVGTAVSNWCSVSSCQPDKSDHDVVRGNRISNTTAENVDIKEGTTGEALLDNSFNGTNMTGADSWVDVKGNGWLISANTGQHSPKDGFQTHEVVNGWGTSNLFTGNVATVDAGAYAFDLTPIAGNQVACDNAAHGAQAGLFNAACSGTR